MKFKAVLLVTITILYACNPIEIHKNVFKFWWQEMDCKYPFFIQKNIDWDSIFITYKEQTQNIESVKLENVFKEVIDYLKDGHCYINTGQKTIHYGSFRFPTINTNEIGSSINQFSYSGGMVDKQLFSLCHYK